MERLPGFRDFYPEPLPHPDVWSADLRRFIFNQWREVARRYGFNEYDGPPIEPLDLYTLKSGAEIVGQLYNFSDKGGREVALRPEMTPTLARMAAAHQRNYKKPIKWFSIPQLFRYERQQKGRLREHFQLNADLLADPDPALDAELIALLIDSLRIFGLKSDDFAIRLSSRNAWHEFFTTGGGAADQEYAFYQVIDKLGREDPDESRKRLESVGFNLDDVQAFIEQARPTAELTAILDNLRSRGLGDYVRIDYGIIRGLAYYSGVVFEAFDRKGAFRAIAGGGRYNHLVKLISNGKVDLPAVGFGMGDVVLTELLKERGLLPAPASRIDLVVLIEDESLRNESLKWIQIWRDAGLSVDYSPTPLKPDKQFKRALDLNAGWTVALTKGSDGAISARLKELKSSQGRSVDPKEINPKRLREEKERLDRCKGGEESPDRT